MTYGMVAFLCGTVYPVKRKQQKRNKRRTTVTVFPGGIKKALPQGESSLTFL